MDEPTLGALARDALAVGASGAVLAVREGSETVVATAGDGTSTSTRFHFGSVGKTFLAALVLGLVDEGRLELDAPLSLYLPDAVSLPYAGPYGLSVRSSLRGTPTSVPCPNGSRCVSPVGLV